jgi:hypothetical protein
VFSCERHKTIYVEAQSKPDGWDQYWNVSYTLFNRNPNYHSVVWGHKQQ